MFIVKGTAKQNSIRRTEPADECTARLGMTIRRLRNVTNISQVELGNILDIHQTAICRIEKGSQTLTPSQLKTIATHFEVTLDSLLAGDIDYWHVAEKFGQDLPIPKEYRELAHSKVRELLPALEYSRHIQGGTYTDGLLSSLKLNGSYLLNPDQSIGVRCNLDILRHMIHDGHLNSAENLKLLTAQARRASAQGFLHHVYETQTSSIRLIQAWIVNSHHYESNFRYEIESLDPTSLVLSVSPNPHMTSVPYRDATLGDFLCRYKKGYFENFPAYINSKPLQLDEVQCHFHGAPSCVYRLRAV